MLAISRYCQDSAKSSEKISELHRKRTRPINCGFFVIYDCFPFFNELELLELRLHELDPVVDKFVLVESTKTFQKEAKELHYLKHRDRFKAFEAKIIHVVVDRFPGFFSKFRRPSAWDMSNHQKAAIKHGLVNCRPDDVIIVSDLDEIPRADKVSAYATVPGTKVFQQRCYSYYLNCQLQTCPAELCVVKYNDMMYWKGPVMDSYANFKNVQEFRKRRNKTGAGIVQVEEGGWHFTYLGGVEAVMYKIRSLEHASEEKYQFSYLSDRAAVAQMLNAGKDLYGRDHRYQFVAFDASYPAYLRENSEKFAHLIHVPTAERKRY